MVAARSQEPCLRPRAGPDLARGQLREKRPELVEALTGFVQAHQRFLLGEQLDHIVYLDRKIARLDEEVARRMKPVEKVLERLDTLTGIAVRGAHKGQRPRSLPPTQLIFPTLKTHGCYVRGSCGDDSGQLQTPSCGECASRALRREGTHLPNRLGWRSWPPSLPSDEDRQAAVTRSVRSQTLYSKAGHHGRSHGQRRLVQCELGGVQRGVANVGTPDPQA